MHDAAGHVHHAGVFVHDHHAAGAHHAANLGDRVVVHCHVDLGSGEQRAGAAAGNHGFEFFAVGYAAGHIVNELFHVHAEWNFVDARLVDVTGDAEQASSAVSRRAAIGVSVAAFANDGRHGAEGFDVIDHGRTAIEANDGREWRLDARITALAFERFHKGGFFAAIVIARSSVDHHIVIEAAAENILAEVAALVGLLDGFFDEIEYVAVFATDINEPLIGSDGTTSDDHAFDQLVRVHFH